MNKLPPSHNDEPFHVVEEPSTVVRDPNYEYYLSLRYERALRALVVLADHVSEEVGLALLEVVDDMDDVFDRVHEYRQQVDSPVQRKMVLNPGWYFHIVDDIEFFTKDPNPPAAEEVRAEKQKREKYALDSKQQYSGVIDDLLKEETAAMEEVFRQYEPDGPTERPFYSSLMDALKSRIPTLDVEVTEERLAKTRSRTRRGMCDVKLEGVSQTHEYRAWSNVMSPQYKQQIEAQGLIIEPTWNSFRKFLSDVGYKPHLNARLVRIDKTAGWTQDNVEWRANGQAMPGLQRRPRGWPLNGERVAIAKGLDRSCKSAVKELLK